MAASYLSGSSALPYVMSGKFLGGFQTDDNDAFVSLPVFGVGGANAPDASDVSAGEALRGEFSSASGSIIAALNAAYSAGGDFAAGNGIDSTQLASQIIQVKLNGSTLNLSTDGVKVADLGITNAQLAADSVVEAKILNGAVTTNKINDDAVTTAKIADSQVTNAKLASAVITTSGDIVSSLTLGASTALTIANDAITTAKIAADAVTTAEILDGTILNANIAAGAGIAFSKLAALNDSQLLVGNGSNVATAVTVTGDVTFNTSGATTIGAGAVDTGKLADDAVTEAKVGPGAVDETGLNSSVAGGGLTGGGGSVLAVGAGTGITVNANDVAVNTGAALTWSGIQKFESDKLQIQGTPASGGAAKYFALKIEGGMLVLTEQ